MMAVHKRGALFAIVVGWTGLHGPLSPVAARVHTLQISHIDVEPGDGTLFVAPGGATLLVDSGTDGHGVRLKQAMRQAGVTVIDHFVCTHYHADHYGGIDEPARDPEVTVTATYDRGDKAFCRPRKPGARASANTRRRWAGKPMSLNNAGDEIALVGPDNQVVNRFRYSASQEGRRIETAH